MRNEKHSITLNGHKTSVTLEPLFWEQLKKIAELKEVPLKKLVEEIDSQRDTSLSSALRQYVLAHYMSRS